jgi:hypothetical protein
LFKKKLFPLFMGDRRVEKSAKLTSSIPICYIWFRGVEEEEENSPCRHSLFNVLEEATVELVDWIKMREEQT